MTVKLIRLYNVRLLSVILARKGRHRIRSAVWTRAEPCAFSADGISGSHKACSRGKVPDTWMKLFPGLIYHTRVTLSSWLCMQALQACISLVSKSGCFRILQANEGIILRSKPSFASSCQNTQLGDTDTRNSRLSVLSSQVADHLCLLLGQGHLSWSFRTVSAGTASRKHTFERIR